MQTISGVHYNFSLPCGVLAGEMRRYGRRSGKRKISAGWHKMQICQLLPFWLGHPLISVWRVSGHLLTSFLQKEANHITV